MATPTLSLRPHLLARAVVILAGTTIVTALLLVHFIPWRFRIHPYPYLSDAGLRDPERIILSFGLALSAALFAPVAAALYLAQESHLSALRPAALRGPVLSLVLRNGKRRGRRALLPSVVPCDALPRVGLRAGLVLAFFLALFTAIPGYFYLHHIFALVFAVSGAFWCLCHALFSHARWQVEGSEVSSRLSPRVRIMYVLIGLQAAVVFFFGVIWGSVKAQFPYKMIPNKDPRFVMLAILEYVGTASFLTFIAMVSKELTRERINLSLHTRFAPKSSSHASCVAEV